MKPLIYALAIFAFIIANESCKKEPVSPNDNNNNNIVYVTGVTVTPATLTIEPDSSQQLAVSVLPGNATNKSVSWSSDNTSVATVDANGLVKGVSTGTANIIVATDDKGKTATAQITV